MKTGIVGGKRIGIDDTGRYIQTFSAERLADGSFGTVSKTEAGSKVVP